MFRAHILLAVLMALAPVPAMTAGEGHADHEAPHAPTAAGKNDPQTDHKGHNVPTGEVKNKTHAGHDGHTAKPEETMPEGYGMVQLVPAIRQAIGVAVAKVERGKVKKELRLAGEVRIPEDRRVSMTLRVDGWITRLLADYEGKTVRKGDTLFWLYSPTLAEVQEELRQARARGDDLLEARVRTRLRLLGVSPEVIAFLEAQDTVLYEIPFLSPLSGVVMDKKVVEGDRVRPGQKAFEIVDLSRVWVEAFLPEQDLAFVREGDRVDVSLMDGTTLSGKVIFLSPTAEIRTRTLQMRAEFPNPEMRLRPGMSAVLRLVRTLQNVIRVPRDALVWSGNAWIVFVETSPNHFMPRKVDVVTITDRWAAIREGLEEGEPVVAQGTFLLDAESRLQATGGGGHHHH